MVTRLYPFTFSVGTGLFILIISCCCVTRQYTQVKVIVNMKGRENEFRNIAIELLRRFQTEIGEVRIGLYTLWSFLIQV